MINKRMVRINRNVVVTFQQEGIHCFPEAGSRPDLADVSFLQYPHRHIFHFRVKASVTHNDRDIEFIQLKRLCMSYFEDRVIDINRHSCEDLCDMLFEKLHKQYPERDFTISCFEDGENGAEISYKIENHLVQEELADFVAERVEE